MNRVVFVPLDDRPATRQTVTDLLPLACASWSTPPVEILGKGHEAPDGEALFRWVEREVGSADAMIASGEALIHGGLVPSRLSNTPMEALWQRLDRLERVAARVPTYLSAVNPRIPAAEGGEEPGYWRSYGDRLRSYSAHLDAGEHSGQEARLRSAMEALEGLPSAVVDDLLRRRRRQLLVNLELLAISARGGLASLLIGQDDSEVFGFTRADLATLRRFKVRSGATRAHISIGADELGARLLARLANDTAGRSPRVAVRYTFPDARRSIPKYEPAPLEETVAGHLEAAGCAPAEEAPDLVLWVHNFPGAVQREAADQRGAPPAPVRSVVAAMAEAASRGQLCGCADVRFANGADDSLVRSLLAREELAGLSGYAGWNTCSNSLGTVIAQLVAALHARENVSAVRAQQLRRRYLARRLLDDWGYQTVVRPHLTREVAPSMGADPAHLGPAAPTIADAALRKIREEVLPSVERALGHCGLAGLSFPWDRLFEAEVHLPDESLGL